MTCNMCHRPHDDHDPECPAINDEIVHDGITPTTVGEDFPVVLRRIQRMRTEAPNESDTARMLDMLLDKAMEAQSSGELVQILGAYTLMTNIEALLFHCYPLDHSLALLGHTWTETEPTNGE